MMHNALLMSHSRRLLSPLLVIVGLIFSLGYEEAGATLPSQPTNGHALEDLGRRLYFDPSLSGDGTISCSTCHKPDRAFSDGRKVAVGIHQQLGTRNTPSLLSLTQGPFFWDGRAATLDDVVLQPFVNPIEMGLHGTDELVTRINQSPLYTAQFHAAFPERPVPISPDQIRQTLTAYLRSIPSGISTYDRYSAGNTHALSGHAQRGLSLFIGSAKCVECHQLTGNHASFTDDAFHSTLINPQLASKLPSVALKFDQNPPTGPALGAAIASDPVVAELGRFLVTHNPKDIGAFRTPSLRNVALAAPYMHDGSAATLRDAVDREIYYRSLQRNEPTTLTEQDRRDLVAFLESLTSE